MNLPLVSIVTPSFNQGRFIERTIRSVLEQDYPKIEYIVMDGGSTDETVGILKRYDHRIIWRSERDAGQSDAINKGFRMAKGEIVAWLNSDDVYLPGAIRTAVSALEAHPGASMVYGDGEMTDEGETWRIPYGVEPFFDLWKLIHLYDFIAQPSVFMRRDALIAAGLVDGGCHFIMDWELWIRMSRVGEVIFTPEILSSTRIHDEAKTQTGRWARWREIREMARRYGNYYWPPAMFIHVPSRYLVQNRGRHSDGARKAISFGRRLLSPLTRGKHSGLHPDGSVAPRGYLSLPALKGGELLVIEAESMARGYLQVRVNREEGQVFLLQEKGGTLRIALPSVMPESGFFHLEFRSRNAVKVPALEPDGGDREVSFRIRDLYFQGKTGSRIRGGGFPRFNRT